MINHEISLYISANLQTVEAGWQPSFQFQIHLVSPDIKAARIDFSVCFGAEEEAVNPTLTYYHLTTLLLC